MAITHFILFFSSTIKVQISKCWKSQFQSQKIQNVMNQELKRIREKDYSTLDERLFNNMGVTDDLDDTLSKLASLQKYIMSQMDTMEESDKKQVALKASQIVMDMGSRIDLNHSQHCNCSQKFKQIFSQIGRIKKSLKSFQESLRRDFRDCIQDMSASVGESMSHLVGRISRKNSETIRLKKQIQLMEQEVEQMKKENEELKDSLTKWEEAKKKRKNKSSFQLSQTAKFNLQQKFHTSLDTGSLNTEFYSATQKVSVDEKFYPTSIFGDSNSINNTPRVPMLLRKDFLNRGNSIQIKAPQSSDKGRQSSKKSCIGNKKSQISQNSFLRMKGAQIQECKKSVKKIKLISMI